ncbi:hypothetical protein [Paraburkholderia franconis]|uniref:hypothetical protein n=1 Tax=Paraburkholderia franconis TaxID=2654983 RepID=UPI001D12AA13|nr:hypothetical protein [Paraburkholderia franconis]
MKHGLVLGLLSGALLVGCMSAGVEVRPEQMATFRRGVTTIQEVTATLGPASVQTALDDGSMLLVYTYVTSRPHPENYIPIIGSLVGGADTHTSAAGVPVRCARRPQECEHHHLERRDGPEHRTAAQSPGANC